MWSRSNVDFLDSTSIAPTPIAAGRFGSTDGGTQRVLSSDADTGATTSIMRLTGPATGQLVAGADLFVLSGHGTCNGTPLRPGCYLEVAAGTDLDLRPSAGPLYLYAGVDGPSDFPALAGPAGPTSVVHVDDLEWTTMSWRGDKPREDVRIKWLRQEENRTMFLTSILPGWQSVEEEVHPVIEESFRLTGDLMMGPRGVIGPGGYFFRREGEWHGPLYSRTGSISLIRKSGLGSTDYRMPPPGDELGALVARAYPADGWPNITQRAWGWG